MKFAREAAGEHAALDMLGRSAVHVSLDHWLLVDAALLDERILRSVSASLSLTMSNALCSSPLAVYGSRAPQFAHLPRDRELALNLVRRLIAIDARAPAISIICSTSSSDTLEHLFSYLARATIDGDLPVYCRFADTRVLPRLLAQLSGKQAARVSLDVRSWSWVDHLGNTESWQSPRDAPPSETDGDPHLSLSTLQLNAMLASSEPDTMFDLLLDNTPELVPAKDRGHFRVRLSRILRSADARSVEKPNDRFQFVILGLGFGESFYANANLTTTWRAIAAKQTTLVDAMKTWDDDVWKQLETVEGEPP